MLTCIYIYKQSKAFFFKLNFMFNSKQNMNMQDDKTAPVFCEVLLV